MEITTELQKEIEKLCRKNPVIIALYLFGSCATGKSRAGSDIDMAVLLEEGKHGFLQLELQLELEDLFENPVDLVIMNRAGEIVKYHVRRDGKLLYEKDPGARKKFEIISRKYFEDYQYLHNRYVRKVLYGEKHG